MVHGGTREGSCGSLRGTHRLPPPGMEAALGMLAGSRRWGIHGPGCECKEVQVESRAGLRGRLGMLAQRMQSRLHLSNGSSRPVSALVVLR